MMKSTEYLYRRAADFQKDRADLSRKYEEEMEALRPFAGSEGFARRSRTLREKHQEALERLQRKYADDFSVVLRAMRDRLSTRKIQAPTDEMLRILEGLRMIEKPTLEQINRAAASCEGCGIALRVLQDMARVKLGVAANYTRMAKEMDNDTAADIIAGLHVQLRDFLATDQTRASRLADRYGRELYGQEGRVSKRKEFRDQREFYAQFCGLDQEETALFSAAVDGTE